MSTLSRPLPRVASPARWARLRLVSDDGLLRLVRQGDECAFDVLVRRYDAPIFAFCKHMLGSREDAEDVMQETWSAAHRAMLRDDRDLTIRAWLYAIARNRCLNAMRSSGPRPTLVPVDVMDESPGGVLHHLPSAGSAADNLADRERFRVLVGDIQELPENQRTALVLHELDALSYDEIAGVLNVSVGAVKSLLVRARVGLTESAEARELDCDDVRVELAAAAQRIGKLRASSKAHIRHCSDCTQFERRMKRTGRSLTAAMSPAPVILLWLQKLGIGKLTGGGGIAVGSAAGGSSSVIGAGGGAFALKAAATVAAAGLATAGAGEVHHLSSGTSHRASAAPATVLSPATTSTGKASPQIAAAKQPSAAAHHSTGSRTALAGVTVQPLDTTAKSSSGVSNTTLRATHAAGGLHVSSVTPSKTTTGRPEVQQAPPPTTGRPTVSQADAAPATPATVPPAAPTSTGSSTTDPASGAPAGDGTPAG